MATHRSALKRIRRNARRRLVNRQNLGRVRTAIKSLRSALAARDLDKARPLLKKTVSLLDRLVRKGTLHGNTVARTKSRLTRHLRRLETGAAAR